MNALQLILVYLPNGLMTSYANSLPTVQSVNKNGWVERIKTAEMARGHEN